ncbi:hypothetical protein G7Y89_g14496 [Cudoniella acicularis]|uniref:Uncharacterized protein n=1 Tax=Cudoniella acicularis TaxID=354080 RepID=A0A8H4R1L6_9HELO|nr:hypothetical protein G7Y89_g14496 [Cudoniella acicularis]
MNWLRNSSEGGHEAGAILEPFLRDTEGEEFTKEVIRTPETFKESFRIHPLIIHAFILVSYITIATGAALFWTMTRSCNQESQIYDSSQHEIRTLEPQYQGNPYASDPRPEHDQAWFDILRDTHIRVSEEELRRINRASLALKDGSGYVAQLGAYHELNCVKWIRKWIHREHYWSTLEGAMLAKRKVHIDHCLEYMRLIAMCRGSQACINWEKFDDWNAQRRVDLYDLDALDGRPATQPWELIGHDVRLGVDKGRPEQDDGFTKPGFT